MNTLLRNILAAAAGIIVGGAVNMSLVMVGPMVVPPPPGADMTTAEGITAALPLLRPEHFLFPFLAHALGSFTGALTAHLIAGSRRALLAYGIGAFTLLGGIMASFMIPAPAWFIALDLIAAYIPMAWLAVKMGERLRPE